jgi:hypothetical protein
MQIADRDLGCAVVSRAIGILGLVDETAYSRTALCERRNDIAAEIAAESAGCADRKGHHLTPSQSDGK